MDSTTLVSVPAFGLRLRADRPILYKFFVNKRELVPAGLHETTRDSDKKVDQQHAEKAIAAGDAHSAMQGRVRPGRVDTGVAVYQNAISTQIGSIRSLLAPKGYRLGDAHFYKKSGFGKYAKDQWVIVLYLSTEVLESIMLSSATVEGLRKLARESTWTANIWDNLDTQTLNFTNRQAGQKAKGTLVLREGFLKLLDLEGEDVSEVERTEELTSAAEIERLIAEFQPK